MTPWRVAVTGAAGFLGRALIARLCEDERVAEVLGIDLMARASGPRLRWIEEDVRAPGLETQLAGIDAVVHLAAVIMGKPRHTESVNVAGSANVFEAVGRAGCRRLVFVSSVAAYGYGIPGQRLTEDHPLTPVETCSYSRTKAAAEGALDVALGRYPHLSTVRLRPCIVLGPGCHPALTLWSRRAIHIGVRGSTSEIQFVHIDDMVEACRLALFSRTTGAFNIAAPGTVTPVELARLAQATLILLPAALALGAARLGTRLAPSKVPDPGFIRMAGRPPLVSTARAEHELGWRASRNARETAEAFLAQSAGAGA